VPTHLALVFRALDLRRELRDLLGLLGGARLGLPQVVRDLLVVLEELARVLFELLGLVGVHGCVLLRPVSKKGRYGSRGASFRKKFRGCSIR
jgi:hypothetical protein